MAGICTSGVVCLFWMPDELGVVAMIYGQPAVSRTAVVMWYNREVSEPMAPTAPTCSRAS